ncbi:N-acetyltransferase eco [Ceratitis capitata]|uniref:N-acetyltransferase eco n=1 Tax=Ceratitis capitata TaxID=7213 RepID=W8AQY9_CERCA|nr:N-acetyltransferase eco [Ceratitis capitata]
METPKSGRRVRITRNPTPRLSARKKSLFFDDDNKLAGNDVLDGIKPLETTTEIKETNCVTTRSRRNIECLLDSKCQPDNIGFVNDTPMGKIRTPLRRSPRTNVRNQSPVCLSKMPIGKENTPNADAEDYAGEHLQTLFNTSMRITSNKNQNGTINTTDRSETLKRYHEKESSVDLSPERKTFKFSPTDEILETISTKKFYSASRPACVTEFGSCLKSPPIVNKMHTRNRARRDPRKNNINKGVKHKIRRPARNKFSGNNYRSTFSSVDVDLILKNVRNEKLKSLIVSKREQRQNIEKIHNIFRSCKNPIEMARPLTSLSGIDDSNNNTYEYTLSTCKNDLSSQMTDEADTDFSDIDSNLEEIDGLSNVEEIIPLISHEPSVIEAAIIESEIDKPTTTTPIKRKFFKSGRTSQTPKEVRITDNIKASICNGKLSLIQEEKKLRKKPKRRPSTTYDISDEQATVEAILKNLDDTSYGDIDENFESHVINQSVSKESSKQTQPVEANQIHINNEYAHFRNRLPYNTNDTAVIEQQHLLLDFLINNNMCTEENFTIFIADPDNHKDEAARIVDQVFVLVNEQDYFRQRIPVNTTDPEIEAQQRRMLEFLIENNICTEDNFDIFIANYNQRYKEADEILKTIRNQEKENVSSNDLQENELNGSDVKDVVEETIDPTPQYIEENAFPLLPLNDKSEDKFFPIFNTAKWKPLEQKSNRNIPRTWNFGLGNNQYQIDAGQKKFGAYQCKQCGLVYSIHEPEEELLHRDYHASLHLLRFKGWIDEDLVAIFPEWGADGRILRITESSHNRRHERLADILKIVDKELGFSSYVIPPTFVAYLAVRKYQIVGLCLVVPLEKAKKYIRVDGVDCCTLEEYPAKCGISRIWVSPLHRRLHIATKLINAVQQNTIFGEEITLDMIAFSAPTENGRMFAQKVTNLENFLVYE